MMGDDAAVQRQQLEGMTIEQLSMRVQQNQQEMARFLEQLLSRAYVQAYTERQYNELLGLLEEALAFIEGLSPLPVEWAGRRNELISKLKRKV